MLPQQMSVSVRARVRVRRIGVRVRVDDYRVVRTAQLIPLRQVRTTSAAPVSGFQGLVGAQDCLYLTLTLTLNRDCLFWVRRDEKPHFLGRFRFLRLRGHLRLSRGVSVGQRVRSYGGLVG